MTAVQIVLALTALVWLGSLVAVVACVVLDSRNDDAWEAERPEPLDERPALPQRRPTDCTPIYDALVCARIELEEGWR